MNGDESLCNVTVAAFPPTPLLSTLQPPDNLAVNASDRGGQMRVGGLGVAGSRR